MADGTTAFAFNVGDAVQFKDGKNTRRGFVQAQEPAEGDYPNGYSILFKVRETGQNRLVRWAASDVQAAAPEKCAFAEGEKVQVEDGPTGKIFEVLPSGEDRLEPQYAVTFKDENGRSAMAWWGESALTAA